MGMSDGAASEEGEEASSHGEAKAFNLCAGTFRHKISGSLCNVLMKVKVGKLLGSVSYIAS